MGQKGNWRLVAFVEWFRCRGQSQMRDMSNNTEKLEFEDKKLEIYKWKEILLDLIISVRELVAIGVEATTTDMVGVQKDTL